MSRLRMRSEVYDSVCACRVLQLLNDKSSKEAYTV